MPLDRKKIGNALTVLMRVAPIVLILAVVCALAVLGQNATVEDILRYTPQSLPLAALVILGIYALKSLSVVFPLMVLYISTGTLFPPFFAIGVNLGGLIICTSLPYLLGRLAGREWVDGMLGKYKGAERLRQIQSANEWFLSYILRVINLLPGDVVSMTLGAFGVGYQNYLLGSLAGLLPTMLAATFLGATILEPKSPAFLFSLGLTAAVSAVSMAVYFIWQRKMKKQGEQKL